MNQSATPNRSAADSAIARREVADADDLDPRQFVEAGQVLAGDLCRPRSGRLSWRSPGCSGTGGSAR